jgi:hypothetical protein
MANRDEMSFSRAFADARREMGGGKTFTWRGNSYTTDLAEEAPARGSRAPSESARPQTRRRSVDEIARSASAAIDRAEGKPATRPQRNPRRTPSTETATSVETRTRMTPEPINRNVRDPQDASPTTSARASTVRAAEDMPPSVRRAIFMASTPQETQAATRIAQEGMDRRMPLRNIIQQIRESIGSRRQNATGDRATSRSQAAADAARARTEAAEEARARRAAGMAKGGMAKKQGYNLGGTVKKGNTDRRNTGMFYDSKSPRGYK